MSHRAFLPAFPRAAFPRAACPRAAFPQAAFPRSAFPRAALFRSLPALLLLLLLALPQPGRAGGDDARLDQLFTALGVAQADEWKVIEDEIRAIWAQSGSPTLDLLLERGNKALTEGDYQAAIEHFTALVDHAPDFAAGWNGRATAYYSAGLYGPALADIARVLRLEPRHFGALTGLGVILEDMVQTEMALKAYRQVLRLNPNRSDVIDAIDALERAAGAFDT